MPDKSQHIHYSAADIEKYWKGQLSAAEQHAMEKAAMDDPMLADAMDGYEAGATSTVPLITSDIEDLQKRLANRVDTKKKNNVMAFSWWKIAAMLAVVLGAAWLFKATNNTSTKQETVTLSKDPAAPQLTVDSSSDLANSGHKDSAIANELAIAKNDKTRPPVPAPSFFYTPEQKSAIAPAAAERSAAAESKKDAEAGIDPKTTEELIANKSATKKETEASPLPAPGQPAQAVASDDYKTADKAFARKADNYANSFSGNITDQSNRPVANAVIQIPNLNISTQTDKKGFFSFRANDTVLNVAIESAGFETQNLRLRDDSAMLNQIVLKPVPASLQDVVTQTNGAEKKKRATTSDISIKIIDAAPETGWEQYDAYLEKNKRVSNDTKHIHGTVVVSFTVRAHMLSNFKIEQSLDDELDEEAIRLIRTGPSWKLLHGKKANATVTVKF